MKTFRLKSSRYLAVAATALAVTFGASYALAKQFPPPGGPGGPGGPFVMQRLQALHGELKLTPEQEQKWQTALTTMKRDHEVMRANHDKLRDQFKAIQQQPILDLDALHATHQKVEQENAQLREETATAWLALYDSLNSQQKTTVSTELKQHFARMERHRERMRERWQQHRPGTAPNGGNPAAR